MGDSWEKSGDVKKFGHRYIRLAHIHSLHTVKFMPPSLYEANVDSSNVLFEIAGTFQGLMAGVPSMKLMGRPN